MRKGNYSNKIQWSKKVKFRRLKVAVIVSQFNPQVTARLTQGSLEALKASGLKDSQRDIFFVPGAFELPLACQFLARQKKYHALIALAAVIKGQTAHFEYISQAAILGLKDVMLKYQLSVGLGVLTCYNLKQALARSRNDQSNKGYEATLAALAMVNFFAYGFNNNHTGA